MNYNNSGGMVGGSRARYLPFGSYRTAPTHLQPAGLPYTDRGFTGQKHNDDVGLIYYNARYYLPGIGRFVSADTFVPDATNPQSHNRFSYTYNNPIKYTDPSGHCVFVPPFDTIACIALLTLTLTGDTPLPPPNYPVNAPGPGVCSLSLPNCFGDIVYLKDFSGYGEDNPIPIAEFEEFADKVAEDLYTHDLTWPGYLSDRGTYDTPFCNGGESERRTGDSDAPNGLWPANQQVCIETIGCSGRSEVNYIAQGMWGAATGEPLPISEAIVRLWKGWEYGEKPSEDTLFWLQYGYDYYLHWREEQE
ncbi:MAG: RHS repeat-associated core domain-containing protein [Ardenticatenales bacterium]|nr:RHS repeat-associated core domain-containing protein [Ardenticatenales bacterium]